MTASPQSCSHSPPSPPSHQQARPPPGPPCQGTSSPLNQGGGSQGCSSRSHSAQPRKPQLRQTAFNFCVKQNQNKFQHQETELRLTLHPPAVQLPTRVPPCPWGWQFAQDEARNVFHRDTGQRLQMGSHPVFLPHCSLPWRCQAPGDCWRDNHCPATTPGSEVLSGRPHPSQAS